MVQTASELSFSVPSYWKSHAHCLPIAVIDTSGSLPGPYCVSMMVWSRAVKANMPATRISGTSV